MTPEERERRRITLNATRLAQVWGPMRPKVAAIIGDLEGHGEHPRIQCAYRSIGDQMACVRAGYSAVPWSFHCKRDAHLQPAALAVDIVDDLRPYHEDATFLARLHSSARAHGLETGMSWNHPWDPWHVQYPPSVITLAAAQHGAWPAV